MVKDKVDYKSMMRELQQLLADMQADDVDVDAALAKYERGRELIKKLTGYLETAENHITKRTLE
jgi:exodeoxyribonuclease VII small subunit